MTTRLELPSGPAWGVGTDTSRGRGGPVTTRLAGWSSRRPWIAIGAWLALVIACYLGGALRGTSDASDEQLQTGETATATRMISDAGLAGHDSLQVLISDPSGARLAPATIGTVSQQIGDRFRSVGGVSSVDPAVTSADGTTALVNVVLDDGADNAQALRDATAVVAGTRPNLTIQATGGPLINADVNDTLGKDFGKALAISVPITLVILLIAFGALIAAGIPVLLGLTSVLAAVGLYGVASQVIPDGGQTAEVILLIGMAVGVDYSLFYLRREREERAAGRSEPDALRIAAATAGHAVVTSGFAVAVALAGMFLIGDVNFGAMALGAIIVVVLAVLGSLTVLPAMLRLLGKRVDRPRIPVLWRLTNGSRPGRLWGAMLRPALKHPAITLVVTLIGMALLALPALGLQLKPSTASDLPRTMSSMQAYDRLTEAFPSEYSTQAVVIKAADRASTEQAVAQLVSAVDADPMLAPHPTVTSNGDTTLVRIAVPFEPESSPAKAALAHVRGELVPATLGNVPGATVAVGGQTASSVDYLNRLTDRLPWVIGFVVLLTLALMTAAFRSLVVGLVTVLVNLLSAAAAFGVLVLVFQRTWAQGLLGFHSSGAIISWIPLFLFVILFGLSMDYHVLVVSRIKEAADRGLPIRKAIAEGITRSAGVVTSAAAVMIAVFAIFAGLTLIEFKELGVGLAVAVLVDAVVVRIMLLPALMALLGRANWWAPKWMRRTGSGQMQVEVTGS
jgi:RND superfamily putative drug exporter